MAGSLNMDANFLNWATSFLNNGQTLAAGKPATEQYILPQVLQLAEGPGVVAPTTEELECPTCFVPSLDLSPDEHGGTVNLYGSAPLSDTLDDASANTTPSTNSLPEPPVDVLNATSEDALEGLALDLPVEVSADPADAAGNLECPTCFVPALDLSPDEHGAGVNLYGSAPTTEGAINVRLTPTPQRPNTASSFADDYMDALFPNLELPQVAHVPKSPPLARSSPSDDATPSSVENGSDADASWRPSSDDDATPTGRRRRATKAACAAAKARQPNRSLPKLAVKVLKDWMLSPEHFDHPYPTEEEKEDLATRGNITVKQVVIWFTNARKRLWVPLRKKKNLPIIGYTEYRAKHRKPAAAAAAAGPAANSRKAKRTKSLPTAADLASNPVVAPVAVPMAASIPAPPVLMDMPTEQVEKCRPPGAGMPASPERKSPVGVAGSDDLSGLLPSFPDLTHTEPDAAQSHLASLRAAIEAEKARLKARLAVVERLEAQLC